MAVTDFIAAIELSSSRLSGIAGRKNTDGSLQVLACASEDASPFIHKGVIYNIDKTAQALNSIVRQLERQLESSIAKVYVGIGGQSLRTARNTVGRTLKEESVISQELVDSICDENLQTSLADMSILDVAPQEYRIDNSLQADPVGVTGSRIIGQFLNIVARNTLKKNVELSFEQARLPIADLVIAPVALAQVLLTENEMRSGCALVDFGADTTTISVYKSNILRYLCVIPLGGNNITRDIATLQIEEEEAERLKCKYGDARYEEGEDDAARPGCLLEDGRSVGLEKLNAIVGARAEEILANVWHQLQLSGYETRLYAGVVFTGGGANLKNLEEAFRKQQNTVSKIKTVRFVHVPVSGCEDRLRRDGTQNTLLGILAAGTENCYKKPEPVRLLFEEEKPPVNTKEAKQETITGEATQEATAGTTEQTVVTGFTSSGKPDSEPAESTSGIHETKNPKSNRLKWRWQTFFDNFKEEMMGDNSDELTDDESVSGKK